MTEVGKETFGSLPRAVGLGAAGGALGGAYLGGASDLAFGSTETPYTDPYPGMIDPTFEAAPSTHYSDPLKHWDTETVPGHLPLDITDTPFYSAVMGEDHEYFPEDVAPIIPVDDFSELSIPSSGDLLATDPLLGGYRLPDTTTYRIGGRDWTAGGIRDIFPGVFSPGTTTYYDTYRSRDPSLLTSYFDLPAGDAAPKFGVRVGSGPVLAS